MHSKLMIVDERLAIMGSANLSNRSMGLDSECCLAIEAEDDDRIAEATTRLRNRLLSEHLGVSIDTLNDALTDKASLIETVESRSVAGRRRLEKLAYSQSLPVDAAAIVPDHKLLDPEAPIEFDHLMDRFSHDQDGTVNCFRSLKLSPYCWFYSRWLRPGAGPHFQSGLTAKIWPPGPVRFAAIRYLFWEFSGPMLSAD
jgi:hypothetical protein